MKKPASIEKLTVRITGNLSEKTSQGVIEVQSWDKRERTLRALKFGAMCWGFALVAVLIPGLHFVLVPGFFIAGPILAFKVLAQEKAVLGGEGTCPDCLKPFPIAKASYEFPFSDLCTQCQSALKIDLKS